MSPFMSPPIMLCPPALVPHMGGGQIPPMCKRPRENPGGGWEVAPLSENPYHYLFDPLLIVDL